MATTSVSSATTAGAAAASTASTNKANAQKLITSLNAGSGVDVASLAQNLVDAEKLPKQNEINAKITKNEARISGYSAVSFVVSEVQTALTALKDQSSFTSVTAVSSNPSAFTVTAGAKALTGTHDVAVQQLARAQRQISSGLPSPSVQLNAGAAMTLNLTVAGVAKPAINLAAGKDTPQDVVDAINAANTGVKAQLINTGDGSGNPYQIVLTGATGATNAFDLGINYGSGAGVPGLDFPVASKVTAQDAKLQVDGITVFRPTNSISDVVAGLTFDLKATATSASVSLTRETSSIKDKLNALVTAYNDANTMFGVVTDPKSTVETYGATLVGDSTVRNVRQQMRSIFQGSSSTPGTTVNSMWQVGIKIDEKGVMSLDSTKLDAALTNNFQDVVKTFTGNTEGLSVYSQQAAGFAGDGVRKLSKLLSATGPMLSQSTNAENQNAKYRIDLTKLDIRMTAMLSRYTKQFSAMDSLVGSVNSQKTSLKATFDGMMAAYTNK